MAYYYFMNFYNSNYEKSYMLCYIIKILISLLDILNKSLECLIKIINHNHIINQIIIYMEITSSEFRKKQTKKHQQYIKQNI